jgi:hypothetical protein
MKTRLKHLLKWQAVLGVALLLGACGSLERSNPVDPGAVDGGDSNGQTLSLVVPVPKPLVSVVDSLVAVLSGPGMSSIVKQLERSPLGPATLRMGAVSPGTERILKIEGYDHAGRLILEGERRNITITAGGTTAITINLNLLEGVNDPTAEPDPEPDPEPEG